MAGRQRIVPVRRRYNQWVADETLEDYALRFTARGARRWSPGEVARTAIGAISFLALEAIGGAITLAYGFTNAVAAILVVGVVIFLTGLPISHYSARYGVDIDLLTRGAGFGYIGSTVTSLVYATFTFILFAIEASIMATALEICLGIPLWLGYILSSLAVIPLVTHGIALITRFQLRTQSIWIVLNVLPLPFILANDIGTVSDWATFPGLKQAGEDGTGFDLMRFGVAASVILALLPQIGEQVDILRFLPERTGENARRWRFAHLAAGPGWIVLGIPKLLFGSFLAIVAVGAGVGPEHAAEPATMYLVAFGYVLSDETMVLAATALLVVVSQLKINVMNAYAGSLAWSNFFSRLTHSHPGRVVWLVFNVTIALTLMELGIYRALEQTLGLFAILAVSWLGAVCADLAINKPLGLSPPGIEFKRAHLYDVNPVGFGAMLIAIAGGLAAAAGAIGPHAQALAPFVSLALSLLSAPLIAKATGGRFALARRPRRAWALKPSIRCSICENAFEPEDTAFCPAYSGPICSLCCSLDARCHDLCKPHARLEIQVTSGLKTLLPEAARRWVSPSVVQYAGGFLLSALVISVVLLLIWAQVPKAGEITDTIGTALWGAFVVLLVVAGIVCWFFVLAHQSRQVAQEESARQTALLLQEIEAHKRTDAALQRAKEVAEAANLAKSRYVVGLSHELRTPLNAVLGYAQLLEADREVPETRRGRVGVIRRSAEHLARLIEGLLDISKIEAGRLQIHRNAVRLADVVDPLVDMFTMQAREKGLAFGYVPAANLPAVVRTDEKRLRQVLINLLSNALKFTDRGGVTLEISYRSQTATITVSDTGVGIEPEDLARVFEPFERGGRSEALAIPGLGLGLTITKMLVELMGGEIRAESTPGEGSRFTARILMTAVEGEGAEIEAPRRIQGYSGPRRTVLVVDDDENQRMLMRDILTPLGFILLEARDAAACRAMVETLRPDLFLLDVSMPGEDGWSLARHLRAAGQTGAILMLSANLGDSVSPPGSGTDHDATMPKPFDLAAFLERVRKLVGADWIRETAVPGAPDPETPPNPAAAAPEDRDAAAPGAAPMPPEAIRELARLGRIGYVRGIEAKLAELAEGGAEPELLSALKGDLDRFDIKSYLARLEGLADGG